MHAGQKSMEILKPCSVKHVLETTAEEFTVPCVLDTALESEGAAESVLIS
jgi:hypothetical protein